MQKLVSFLLVGLISLSITGCSLLLKEVKKEEAKPAPKQEQTQQNKPQETKPQDEDSANADSVLEDSRSIEVDSMTVYVDDRTWTPQPFKDGYEMYPDASSFEQGLEGIFVEVEERPIPRLDENAAEEIVKHLLNTAPSDDVKIETLKSESDEVMFRIQVKINGKVVEGFVRYFGNDQKSGLVAYMTAKNTSEEDMEIWQKRIEAATFSVSL